MSFPPSTLASARDSLDGDSLFPLPRGAAGSWPDTDHSALAKLRDGSAAEKEEALRQFFAAYAYPLRQHIRYHWPLLSEADIDELVSEFSTLCLTGDKAHFLAYEPERPGSPVRLRTYLRTILDNFLRNHSRRAKAQIRGGNRHFESLDTVRPAAHQEAPGGIAVPLAADMEAYDRHWAQHILSLAFGMLESGTPVTREWLPILRPWILADPGDSTLKQIASDKGCTHTSVRTQLHRLRKAWRQAIRVTVSRTVPHPDDVDDELRHLAAVLSRHPVE